MLQVIAICSCISAVCLWCGFVSVCCPRIFNRISKLPGRRFRCSRCPEDQTRNKQVEMPEGAVEETEEEIGGEEVTETIKSPSKSRDMDLVGTANAKRDSSSLIEMKGDEENEGVKGIAGSGTGQSSKASSVKKKNGISSGDVDFDREKLFNKPETRVPKQVDNYTSITSTLSAFSKSSNETSLTNSEGKKRSVRT